MAAGDVNSRTVLNGNVKVLTGTLEAANGTAVALFDTNTYIVACWVQNADDQEGAQVELNTNDGSATVNGSIYVTSAAADVDTWNYTCLFI